MIVLAGPPAGQEGPAELDPDQVRAELAAALLRVLERVDCPQYLRAAAEPWLLLEGHAP